MNFKPTGPDFDALQNTGAKGLAGKRKAVGDAQALGKQGKENLQEGKDLLKAMGKEATRRATDAAIDAGAEAALGPAGKPVAAVIKKHKRESLILLLIMIIAGLTPYLFILYLIFGADFLMQQQQGSTLQITKTGPAAVGNPNGNGPDIAYTISVTNSGQQQDATIIDKLPANATFVSATGNYTTDPPGGGPNTKTVTWTISNTNASSPNTANTVPGNGSGKTFTANGTGYYPATNALEGGFKDMQGKPLQTLQDFLAGKASYVSVAMDKGIFPYGTSLTIKELDQKYSKHIDFRVVDTGSAFTGKGTSRIDIATADSTASLDHTINGSLTITVGTSTTLPNSPGGGSTTVTITLRPTQKDSYVINEAQVSSGAAGGNTANNTGFLPPTTDTCGGKYPLKNPLGKNFGDPDCKFMKDALHAQLLLQLNQDTKKADIWFNKIIPCVSGYDPNAYSNTGQGTWGLFQQGKGIGDTDWKTQVSNVVSANADLTKFGHCAQ